MATGPDHYREAEHLLKAARVNTEHFYGEHEPVPTPLAAVAHALLARTAAAAVGEKKTGMSGLKLPGNLPFLHLRSTIGK